MTKLKKNISIPILPTRDKVIFPNVPGSLVVGRDRSIKAIQYAIEKKRLLFVVAQRHLKVEEPGRDDLFEIGTMADVLQSAASPDGLMRLRVAGRARARLIDVREDGGCLVGDVEIWDPFSVMPVASPELEALRRLILKKFQDYAQKTGRIPMEMMTAAENANNLDELADILSDGLYIHVEEKQDLLETLDVQARLQRLVEILDAEIEISSLERKIQNRVHKQIERNQREYYLNEQMRAIQKELKKKDELTEEVDAFRKKIAELKMPAEAEEAALKEATRLEKMMVYSPEATVVRNYLEWIVALPWNERSTDDINIQKAKTILDEDHYGLEKPKERLLEYLAVLKLTKNIRGPILCFVGPPGTGKTSLSKSLARAMGRKFVRISLGGVRDEAEIRGHRRTYIGSLPGRILQGLRKAKTKNPVILLDEIDKMGGDWRGDPAAALLEVLDPEQNKAFNDHFLEVGFDLSEIIFIATANSLYTIPQTLLDRLEVLRYSAYTTEEKVAIATKYILPKELKEHGLPVNSVRLEDEALRKIIHHYTQEAGVRDLQRKIAKLCRKVAVEIVRADAAERKTVLIGLNDVKTYLGIPEFIKEKAPTNTVGLATGLAWTDHGGETLSIEVTTMPGQGKILLTGKLGAVMQESAQTAFSFVKSRAASLGLGGKRFPKIDIHIHVPEGAVPKDGPSAGTGIATAIVSALTGRPVKSNVAMTGEITLQGRVLPIGGLKEKVLAAYREGLKEVLFPFGNIKDLEEISETIQKEIKLIPVKTADDVFHHALLKSIPKSAEIGRKSASLAHPN